MEFEAEMSETGGEERERRERVFFYSHTFFNSLYIAINYRSNMYHRQINS